MKRYVVRILEPALAALQKLPVADRHKLWRRIVALGEQPRPAGASAVRTMSGMLRIRVGDYRVIYVIRERQVLVIVLRVAHRAHAYDRLPDVNLESGVDLPGLESG